MIPPILLATFGIAIRGSPASCQATSHAVKVVCARIINSQNDEIAIMQDTVFKLLSDVCADQSVEIARMENMLSQLPTR